MDGWKVTKPAELGKEVQTLNPVTKRWLPDLDRYVKAKVWHTLDNSEVKYFKYGTAWDDSPIPRPTWATGTRVYKLNTEQLGNKPLVSIPFATQPPLELVKPELGFDANEMEMHAAVSKEPEATPSPVMVPSVSTEEPTLLPEIAVNEELLGKWPEIGLGNASTQVPVVVDDFGHDDFHPAHFAIFEGESDDEEEDSEII